MKKDQNIHSKHRPYHLAENTFQAEEIQAAKEVLDSSRLTMGERVRQFESEFAAWTGAPYAVMVNSGSSANLLVMEALLRSTQGTPKLQPGDEVAVPALSWPTTVWPLVQLGLVPVFVDIDPNTLSINIESLEKTLSSKTKAVFVVHVLGQMGNMDKLSKFCRSKGLLLIEDGCESLGSHFHGQHAGLFGLMGTFSCYFSHHISTIEGGFVITKDENIYNDLISMRSHGWIRGRKDEGEWKKRFSHMDSRFLFISSGYNLRPTEIQAAIGSVQLKRLDEMINSRIQFAQYINELASTKTPWMKLIGAGMNASGGSVPKDRRERTHSWMTLPFVLDKNAPIPMRTVQNLFEEASIETRPIIAGNLTRHPAFEKIKFRKAGSLTQSDHVFEHGFMMGCHPKDWEEHKSRFENIFNLISLQPAEAR
jgi:CDP-6-deoxy-D-xylo-4-hexulose-3-dehydrase